MEMAVLWLLMVVVISVWLVVRGYNRLQWLSQSIGESRSNIENSLATRSDLVTQLFEIAKENGVHEAQIHSAVAQLESHPGGLGSAGIEGLMNVMTPINRAYPDLKASEGYMAVMGQLQQVENEILSRRDQYNAAVRVYNTTVNSLPTLLWASTVGFAEAPFYDNKNPETLALFQGNSGEKMREAVFNVSIAIADKSTEMGGALIDESRQIGVKTARTVIARGREIADYGRKVGRHQAPDEGEVPSGGSGEGEGVGNGDPGGSHEENTDLGAGGSDSAGRGGLRAGDR